MIEQGRSTPTAGRAAGAALILALVLVLLAPAGARAAENDRDCGTFDPVYELQTFNGVSCRTADTLAFRPGSTYIG